MRGYGKYIKPHLKYFICGPLLMLVEVGGEVLLPWLMAQIIKYGVGEANYAYVIVIGLVMVLAGFIMMVGGVGGNYFATKAATGFAQGLRRDTFIKVQSFSFNNIDKFSTGSLVTRLTNDVTQLQNIIRMSLIMLLRAPGMLIGATIMALNMNKSLAGIILLILPVLLVVIVAMIKTAFPRFNIMQKKIDALNSDIRENLTNVRVVKSFVREKFEENKFREATEELKENSLKAFNVMIFASPIMSLAMNVTTIAVVWVGGNQVIGGEMDVADLTAFTNYIGQILMSLMMVAMILLNSSRALASSARIKEVLNTESDLNDYNAERPEAVVEKGRVEFKNVSFRYYKNSEDAVLDNISFTVEAGETVGVIGSTGSGKTTMLQMIPRLYDVDEGEVLVDGINVKDYSIKNLRDGVGMVLQKNVLFSGTIEENLRWGNAEASEEEVREAADSAQADLFVKSFTEAYNTELGQGGVNVSGGQKQRLCIARALLKKPKILILDDSTSAVDTATEAKIREAFRTTLKCTTKFIIAQRISSVIEADRIIVLDDGKIVGIGKHDELIENCAEYQEIYDSQMDKREVTA